MVLVFAGNRRKSALDYLIKVNGYSFLEAMERIVGQAAAKPPVVVSSEVKEKPKTLLLPEKYRYAEYAASYLEKRGISPELISFCISTGRMYESNPYHNVVFVGFDKQGKARFALPARDLRHPLSWRRQWQRQALLVCLASKSPKTARYTCLNLRLICSPMQLCVSWMVATGGSIISSL